MSTQDEAFTAFVVARQAELVRLGWALLGDRQLGEDLAQTALQRLWPHWALQRVADSRTGELRGTFGAHLRVDADGSLHAQDMCDQVTGKVAVTNTTRSATSG